MELAGLYDLMVSFEPSTGSCQQDTTYDFLGAPGEECSNPNNPDCLGDFPQGCCADIGDGDFFCLPASFCEQPEPYGGSSDGGMEEDGGMGCAPPGWEPPEEGESCGCQTGPSPASSLLLLVLGALLLMLRKPG